MKRGRRLNAAKGREEERRVISEKRRLTLSFSLCLFPNCTCGECENTLGRPCPLAPVHTGESHLRTEHSAEHSVGLVGRFIQRGQRLKEDWRKTLKGIRFRGDHKEAEEGPKEKGEREIEREREGERERARERERDRGRERRSEERRVGKECLRLCRSRWSPYH